MSAIDDMIAAFQEYETAIETAQRRYHNYQEWTREEWDPIEAASGRFYEAAKAAQDGSKADG